MDLFPELKREWKLGWQLDLEFNLPRIVFCTANKASLCFIYELSDFDSHLLRQCITNLQYIEGKFFYLENRDKMLKRTFENRVPFNERDNYKKEHYHATRNYS